MGDASIPVDLRNPGQVFACLGFLEVADALSGRAEGGFDWSGTADIRFNLRTSGEGNPVEVVLEFLGGVRAEPIPIAGVAPAAGCDEKTSPVVLRRDLGPAIPVGHWADGSTRDSFKQFGGQQTGYKIIQEGQGGRPALLDEIRALLVERRLDLLARPFDCLRPLGGSFKFDARAAWRDRDVGYSLDEQKELVQTSPVVELAAAIGLEHARPAVDPEDPLDVRYSVWSPSAPPTLARAALGTGAVGLRQRTFRFRRNAGEKGYYKQATFATEEVRA